MTPWTTVSGWLLVVSFLCLESTVIAVSSSHDRTHPSSSEDSTRHRAVPLPVRTQAGQRQLDTNRAVPLPVRTQAGQRKLDTNHRAVPLPVRTQAGQRKLETHRAVPLPVRTQAGQRQLKTRAVPLPVRTQAGQRALSKNRAVPLPVRTQAGQRHRALDELDNVAVVQPSFHRRLGQDKNPVPTMPPTKKEDDATLTPTVGPLDEPDGDEDATPVPSVSVVDPPMIPDFEQPPTLRPSSGVVLPPVLNDNGSTTTAPAVNVVANTGTNATTNEPSPNAPPEPEVNETDTATMNEPSPAPTTTPATETVPLASFNIMVVATLLKTSDRAEQLKVYRKVIRTSLQTYLAESLASTTVTSSDQTSSSDLVHVLLRVVETRTDRRSLQQDESSDETSELTTVEQVFSYAGDAVFLAPAPPDATPTFLQQQQALALSLTSDVQRAIDAGLGEELVTVQSVDMWELSTDTPQSSSPQSSSKRVTFGSQNSMMIGSIVGGVALLAVGCGLFMSRRWRRPQTPPPLITATKKVPVDLPFSPYGKEDDDRNNQRGDVQHIVSDLESLEESWHEGPIPNQPYLQLTLTGATSAESSKGASFPISPMGTIVTTASTAVPAGNVAPTRNATSPVTIAPVHVDSRATDGTVEKAIEDYNEPAQILSIHKIPEEKKEEERAMVQPSLYATPVIAMSSSGDSMEGFSLHGGFYGTAAGSRTAPSAHTTNLLQDYSPPVKTRPPWMTAPKITSSDDDRGSSTEEYTSDSESQFSYNNIGAIPKSSTKGGLLGPALHSMSMDSDDTSPSYSNADELMLTLNHNPSGATLTDSPSFRRPQATEHLYTHVDRDTPVMANNSRAGSYLPDTYSAGKSSNNVSDEYDDDGDSDDDPLRTAALSRPATVGLESYRSVSHRLTSPLSAVANQAALQPQSSSPSIDRSELESQPSDEMMEDSMAQDLEGFADELARIKRDIGLSTRHHQAQVENTPVARWGTTSHPDALGAGSSKLITPDDESRIDSRRRNV